MIDADSHEVRAVEMTDQRHGDSEIVPDLLARLPKAERIGVVSGDEAHDACGVYEASAARLNSFNALGMPDTIAHAWSEQDGNTHTLNLFC